MIRLLLLLCATIFVTLQIGGQDRGQMRFGLMQAEPVGEPVDEPATQAAAMAPVLPEASAAIVPVAFAPAQPLITPVVQPQTPVVPEALPATDVRYVMGRSVNVRSGPSTQNAVVGRLTRGEAVRVVRVEDNGWAEVRIEGDGIDGFMSLSFLSDTAP